MNNCTILTFKFYSYSIITNFNDYQISTSFEVYDNFLRDILCGSILDTLNCFYLIFRVFLLKTLPTTIDNTVSSHFQSMDWILNLFLEMAQKKQSGLILLFRSGGPINPIQHRSLRLLWLRLMDGSWKHGRTPYGGGAHLMNHAPIVLTEPPFTETSHNG